VLQVSGGVHIHALESNNNLIMHIRMRQKEIEPLLQEWKSQIWSARMENDIQWVAINYIQTAKGFKKGTVTGATEVEISLR